MSELIQKYDSRTAIRWKLLTGASALALTAYVSSASIACAEDGDRPQLWIELGGQLDRVQDSQELFEPPFVKLTPSNFAPPQNATKPPRFGVDGNAALTFQPHGFDWTFSASISYGRASNDKHAHQQTYPLPTTVYEINRRGRHFYFTVLPSAARFTDAVVKQSESHVIVDFQVGKDVGLGLFGGSGSSFLNVGIRFAQFQSKSRVSLHEDPDWRFDLHVYGPNYYGFITQAAFQPYHSFAGTFRADRSFNGVGPSLSWNGSTPIIGDSERGALTFDWSANASVLFGRQKTRTQHETTALYHPAGTIHPPPPVGYPSTVYHNAPPPQARSRSVIVPNLGALVGLSVKYPNVKVSFGYKADFFFGAMDGGIDVRRTTDVGFHGPYASVSIGLGG